MALPGTVGKGVIASLLWELKFWVRYLLPSKYVAVYYPTQGNLVRQMLKLAEVKPDDVVFDLGCGDGRIVIAAAQQHGARGVGVELDPQLAALARRNVNLAGVSHLVRIIHGDAAKVDISAASVVALYLSERGNASLLRAVQSMLQPSTRIVSLYFPIRGWEARLKATDVSQRVHIYMYHASKGIT